MPAYLPIEKIKITQKYLIPRFEKEYAYKPSEKQAAVSDSEEVVDEPSEKIQITEAAIQRIINHYCAHEAGVRNLRKALDQIFRKVTAKIEVNKEKESLDAE